MKALVFAGSTRSDSLHRKLAAEAAAALRKRGVEVTHVELRDFPMPLYDGDLEVSNGLPPAAHAFRALLAEHDAVVIASPEYNGSFPALVKNVVDWTSRPAVLGERPNALYRGKPVALLAGSPGPGGGRRGLRHLRELLEMIGMKVVGEPLAIPNAYQALDSENRLSRLEDVETFNRLIDTVAQSAEATATA